MVTPELSLQKHCATVTFYYVIHNSGYVSTLIIADVEKQHANMLQLQGNIYVNEFEGNGSVEHYLFMILKKEIPQDLKLLLMFF